MAEGERILILRKKPKLNREEKTGLGMVVSFGSLALVFGAFYLWKHIASPFVVQYVGPKFLTGDQKQQAQMELLKKQDTDVDALNDYDEMYVYKTSPYLKDTDGDGTEDGLEISMGGDPNCAPNMPCSTVPVDEVNPVTLKGTFAEDIADHIDDAPIAPWEVKEKTPEELGNLFLNMSNSEIQDLLIESGGDSATVKSLSEEQLRAALSQAILQLESETYLNPAINSETAPMDGDTSVSDTTPTPQQ